MNYETIDWEAEAGRVARAFGIEEEIRFENEASDNRTSTRRFYFDFCLNSKYFVVEEVIGGHRSSICFFNDGTLCLPESDALTIDELCRGLFNLNLLTPEVETALEVIISQHQRLEWMLDFEK